MDFDNDVEWGTFYDIAVDDLGIQPSEFWKMSPQEFWRLHDKRVETNNRIANPGHLANNDKESLLQTLKDYRTKNGIH
ncbi:phage tail assembly chaperone [Prosthecochloris sp.]|uniref:phage tail assembly chaperone n=1 Tax=Prosthecochloris sp. TaxID=290513 RepID=UPI00344D3F7E